MTPDPLRAHLRVDDRHRRRAPEDALARATRRGRHYRAVGTTAAAGTTASVVSAALVVLAPADPQALEVVEPAGPGQHKAHASPSAPRLLTPVTAPQPPQSSSPSPRTSTDGQGASRRPASSPASGKYPWHKPVSVRRSGTSTLCVQNGNEPITQYPTRDGWCVSATPPDGAGVRSPSDVELRICRTGVAGELRFRTAQELEVTVRDDAGRVRWTWSRGVRVARTPHTRTIAGGDCWSWTTSWNGTTDDGTPLAPGSYTAVLRITREGAPVLDAETSIMVKR